MDAPTWATICDIYFLGIFTFCQHNREVSIKWERPNAENRENETIERKRDEETEINERRKDNKQTENGNESISEIYLKRLAVSKKSRLFEIFKRHRRVFWDVTIQQTRTYYTYHNMGGWTLRNGRLIKSSYMVLNEL